MDNPHLALCWTAFFMPTRNDILTIRGLRDKSTRYTERKFVVEGHKCVKEALASGWSIHQLFVTERTMGSDFVGAESVSSKDMERMSGFKNAPGVLAVVGMPDVVAPSPADWLASASAVPMGLILDGLSDPGNLGTLVRTLDWLGVNGVWCLGHTVDAFNPKVVQASMGAIFRVPVWSADDGVVSELRSVGAKVMAMNMQGTSLWEMEGCPAATEPWVGVLGSESHGIRPAIEEACGDSIHIPGRGGSESLNATMACGMIMGEWTARLHRAAST